MAARIRPVEYFRTTVHDRPGEAYKLLSHLASERVNLLAFSAVPMGGEHTQLVIFPEHVEEFARAAESAGIIVTGPERAIMVQGDDELGALVGIHRKLYDAGVNVFASSGVTDGKGGCGYVMYVRPADFDDAIHALDVD